MTCSDNHSTATFSDKALRSALGSFATGVTIVTTIGQDGRKVGMTVNSFNSVSLSPPLVLWSLGRHNNCFDDFIAAKSFAIHVLASDQQKLSQRFAEVGNDRFDGLECSKGICDTPLLPHYSACFQCIAEHQYQGGDHVILLSKVVAFTDRGHKPLLFHRGQYSRL